MDAGQVRLLDCPARLSINEEGKGDLQEENLNNSWQSRRLRPWQKLIEVLLKLTLVSRLVFLYVRGRDIPRVPN